MRRLLLIIACLSALHTYAQDFSNKGRDFWVGYGNHVRMFNGGGAEAMQVYITSDVNTTGNVSIPGIGFSQNYTVVANQITTIDIPRGAALMDEGLYNRGIHITAIDPVVAYGFIYVNAISGATVYLPTNTLGKNYYSVNYTQVANENNCFSYFFVVAADTGTTTVQITPTQATKGGWAANTTQTITLTQGQVYQVLSSTDLTGSTIRSVSANGIGCKRIAVFCGSGKISIGCTNAGSSDNLYQQMYPTATWGKKYIAVPSINIPNQGPNNGQRTTNLNYFRIYRPSPGTNVQVDGVTVPAASFTNNYYDFSSSVPKVIVADTPILVAQYFTTESNANGTTCGGNYRPHDPEMIYINPVEQTLKRTTLNSMYPPCGTGCTNINQHFVNIVVKNAGSTSTALTSFRIDGAAPTVPWTIVPLDPNYSYIQVSGLANGAHTLTCDSGFNAISYGFGQAESYGYSAGVNLVDLTQVISTNNQLAAPGYSSTSACVGSPFYFSVTLPYQPSEIRWRFNGLFNDTTVLNPVSDSTYTVNGKPVWRYKLLKLYTVLTANFNPGYPVTITTINPNNVDGCSGINDISFYLLVYNPPGSGFDWTYTGCYTDSVKFRDTSNAQGSSFYLWNWDFGEPSSGVNNTSSLQNPIHKYAAPGTYKVKLFVVTVAGCISLTDSAYVTVTDVPVAAFSQSNPQCVGKNITFTNGSSVTAPATLTQWTWNFGDASAAVVNAVGTAVTHAYAAVGTYYATLQVKTNSGCLSKLDSLQVIVNPNPVADFSLPNVCLPIGAAQFNDQSTISDATQRPFTYQWNFGDPGSGAANTSTTVPGIHNYSATGSYNINLIVTSAKGCVHDTTKVLSTVFARPTAGITNPSTELCFAASMQFGDNSSAPAQTVAQYFWDFGDPALGAANTSSAATPPPVIWNAPGTYTVKHWLLTTVGCYSDTAKVTITVHPWPTASFTMSSPSCETKPITFTSTAVPNVGTLTRWQWTMGDWRSIDTTNGNPFQHTYATWGNYPVKLTVTNSKGCVSTVKIDTARIHPQPRPDFPLPEVCLSDAFAQFYDSTKIADGTQSLFTYLWDFGDPSSGALNTSILKDPRHKYNAIGLYNVSLTVTSNNGCVEDTVKQITVNGAIPKSDFRVLNAAGLCSNDTVRIRDTSTVDFGNVTRLIIDWGDGNTDIDDVPNQSPNGKTYAHKYAYFGTPLVKVFTVKVTAYSGGTCFNLSQQDITVHASPDINFIPPGEICQERLAFVMHYANDMWNLGGQAYYTGPGVSQDSIFTAATAGVGTHTITYTAISPFGCRADSSRVVTINPQPVAAFNFLRACLPATAALFTDLSTVSNATQTPFTYQWDFGEPSSGANNTSTLQNPSHLYSTATTFPVTLITTSTKGCSDTIVRTMDSVYAQPKAFINPRSAETCFGNSVTFTDNSNGITRPFAQWLWQFGDGSTSTSQNPPPKTYTEPKTYIVKLSGFTDVRCPSDVDSIIVKIDSLPTPDFNVSLPRCQKNDITFTDLSLPNTGSITEWRWDLGDGSGLHVFNPPFSQFTYIYNDSNYYDVTLEVTNNKGCIKKSPVVSIFVAPLPVADAGGPRLTMLEGGVLILPGDRSRGRGLTYLWTPNYNLSDPRAATPAARPADDFYYLLKVTSQEGCTDTAGVFVKVLKYPLIPNIFTPNGDGINDRWVIEYLDTYPGCLVEVYTPAGQLVYRNTGYATPWDGTKNGKPLPGGTYYYIIEPKNGRKVQTGSVTIIR